MKNLITAGELAKLASTTKRTIQFYDQKDILKPIKISDSQYRLYDERQILEYQMILLLTTLGVSLNEIKAYISKKGNLTNLFNEKKAMIENEIEKLQFNLKKVKAFLANLKSNKTMIKPQVKTLKPLKVYFIEKKGPYAKIEKYCQELSLLFERRSKKFTTMTIFEDPGYLPKKSHMKICALIQKNMKIKKGFENDVKKMIFNPGKVISYCYTGPSTMLSLFWKELEKYCRLNDIEIKKDVPDFEIYWQVNPNPFRQKFEIFLPIK